MRYEVAYVLIALLLASSPAVSQKQPDKTEAYNSHNILIDGSLTDEEAASSPYIYNDFTKASHHFIDGTSEQPMVVNIKPWVYWIDNPNDTTVMVGENGQAPIGLFVKCQHLQLIGLGENPHDVVLASRRGQTQGAIGNYTMLDFTGDNLVVKNLTMGNFCNVDLEYPLRPELSMKKKSSTITQAHVAYCHGDNIYAENVRFISRLNMNPLGGARRILFKDCHLEMTDDALCSTGVYLHCDFDFYGQRPAWNTDTYGAIFIDCDFNVKHNSTQFFCKSQNPVTVINCRYHNTFSLPSSTSQTTTSETNSYAQNTAGWTAQPSDWLRCYQYNNTYNSTPINIGIFPSYGNIISKPYNTITLSESLVRERFTLENILSDKATLATGIRILPRISAIETGHDTLRLSAQLYRHCGQKAAAEPILWRVQPGFENFISIMPDASGMTAVCIPKNESDNPQHFYIEAYTASGLVGATEVDVKPSVLPSPSVIKKPTISIKGNTAALCYALELKGRADKSIVDWYRCVDKKGTKDILVAVSHVGEPLLSYPLSLADDGYYLKAVIHPKHIRSEAGQPVSVYSKKINSKHTAEAPIPFSITTDNSESFAYFPTINQPDIIPGFWTLDGYKPADTNKQPWTIDMSKNYWTYGKGFNGAIGYGLLQAEKGARLLYTPLKNSYKDMEVTWQVDPTKAGGQGFGSATDQYMDVYIKFDTKTLTGYALRIERTVKYGNAVDFALMRYENGKVTPISESISSTCYRTGCTIHLVARQTTQDQLSLSADVTTKAQQPDTNLPKEVHLQTNVPSNYFGGFGLQHTGSCGESTTMIHSVTANWK